MHVTDVNCVDTQMLFFPYVIVCRCSAVMMIYTLIQPSLNTPKMAQKLYKKSEKDVKRQKDCSLGSQARLHPD